MALVIEKIKIKITWKLEKIPKTDEFNKKLCIMINISWTNPS